MPNQTKIWLFGSRWPQPKLQSFQGGVILFCLGCIFFQNFEFDLLEQCETNVFQESPHFASLALHVILCVCVCIYIYIYIYIYKSCNQIYIK
jgi:hypothetical protein